MAVNIETPTLVKRLSDVLPRLDNPAFDEGRLNGRRTVLSAIERIERTVAHMEAKAPTRVVKKKAAKKKAAASGK